MIYVLRIVFCSMYELNGSSLYIVKVFKQCFACDYYAVAYVFSMI